VTRNPTPGAALLHPVTLVALFTLALNDQVLKRLCPSWLTGKLSDFAGLILLPLFLHALCELAAARAWRRPFSAVNGDRWLLVCVVVSLSAFALPEIWKPAELAYRFGLGAARWPFRVLAALLSGHELPSMRPVRATADVTDLLALPMGFVAFAIGRRRPGPAAKRTPRAALAAFFLVVALFPGSAAAASPFRHDGFYLSMEAGPGALWVSSSGSISNGFQQELPSSASALVAPATTLALGGTIANLVLGGRLAVANGVSPVVETLGRRFKVPEQHLLLIELGPMAQYYPDPKRGLHFGLGFGFAWLGATASSEGAAPGFSGSAEVGHGFFLFSQWSLGATLRMTVARTYTHAEGDLDIVSTTLLPALLATVTLH
jgi:hypothetical protein